ncbi:MAG: ATP synthase subunit b [Phycisphaerae bacterium]|nr:ATP synthase subunit b [Phycisphaerae bacterium]
MALMKSASGAGVLGLLLPAMLLASEAHGAEKINPFEGTVANAVVTLITFGIVLFVLGKFVWPAVLTGLQRREEFIRNSLQTAKQEREEAEKLLKQYQEQIAGARQQATAIVDEGRRDAEVLRHKIQAEAKTDADAMLERARREIGIARDTAVKDLYTLSGKLATDLAGRIIQKEIDPATHERLIRDSINDLSTAKLHN